MMDRVKESLFEERKKEITSIENKVWLSGAEIERGNVYYISKRILDVLGSIVGLILLMPVMGWIVYKIQKEEPKSPVLFIQERVGKDGKKFKIYKFRTMCIDAEKRLENLLAQNEVQGAMFKIKEDPRVTRIGRFIREKSLDELPQLWNVLRGDMSLVGPRPPLPREVIAYNSYDRQRLLVQPGCSGLWQVSGRSDLHFDDMVKLDLEYIKNRSITLDLLIIFKTFKTIVKSEGAY